MILIPKYKESVELVGSISFVLTDTLTNTMRQEIYVPNLVVTTGKEFIASRMVNDATNKMSHMAIGVGSTAEVVGNTALVTELSVIGGYTGYTRAALTTSAAIGATVTYVATFAAGNPSAPSEGAGGSVLREAGIFNGITASTMLCRTTYPTVTKLPADALTITWTITIQ